MNSKLLVVISSFLLVMISCKKEKAVVHPYVDFTYSGNVGITPILVSFNCNLASPYIVDWDFGDGTKGEGQNVSHTYLKQGFYKVYANAKSDEGQGGAVNNVNVSPYLKLKIYQVNGGVSNHQPNGSTCRRDDFGGVLPPGEGMSSGWGSLPPPSFQ